MEITAFLDREPARRFRTNDSEGIRRGRTAVHHLPGSLN